MLEAKQDREMSLMHAQEKKMYVILALFLFIGSAGLTYWLVKDEKIPELVQLTESEVGLEPSLRQPQEARYSEPNAPSSPGPSGTPAVTLQAGATFVRLFDGEDGQVHTLPTVEVPESLVGKNEDEVARLNPDWAVLDLQPDRLTVKVELAEAALATGTRYLGVHDGRVAIFRGKPGVASRLERVTDIPVEWLPEYEQENLRKGYVFAEHELEMILESLAEAAEARRMGE